MELGPPLLLLLLLLLSLLLFVKPDPKYPPFFALLEFCDSLVLPRTGFNELVNKCIPSVFKAKDV